MQYVTDHFLILKYAFYNRDHNLFQFDDYGFLSISNVLLISSYFPI